jgi:hypothetical protein
MRRPIGARSSHKLNSYLAKPNSYIVAHIHQTLHHPPSSSKFLPPTKPSSLFPKVQNFVIVVITNTSRAIYLQIPMIGKAQNQQSGAHLIDLGGENDNIRERHTFPAN